MRRPRTSFRARERDTPGAHLAPPRPGPARLWTPVPPIMSAPERLRPRLRSTSAGPDRVCPGAAATRRRCRGALDLGAVDRACSGRILSARSHQRADGRSEPRRRPRACVLGQARCVLRPGSRARRGELQRLLSSVLAPGCWEHHCFPPRSPRPRYRAALRRRGIDPLRVQTASGPVLGRARPGAELSCRVGGRPALRSGRTLEKPACPRVRGLWSSQFCRESHGSRGTNFHLRQLLRMNRQGGAEHDARVSALLEPQHQETHREPHPAFVSRSFHAIER